MSLSDFKIFDVSVKEKARVKRFYNGKVVVTGGCKNSRIAVARYLKTIAFLESSSGNLVIANKIK